MKTQSESLVWVTLRQSESNALQFLLFFSFLCRKTILVRNRSFLLVFVRRLSDCFHPSLLPTFSSLWPAVPSEELISELSCLRAPVCAALVFELCLLLSTLHLNHRVNAFWILQENCSNVSKWVKTDCCFCETTTDSILLKSKVNDKWQTESWCLPLLLRPLYYGGITQDYSAYMPTSPHKQMPKSLPYTEAEVQSQKSIWSKSCSDFSSLILP